MIGVKTLCVCLPVHARMHVHEEGNNSLYHLQFSRANYHLSPAFDKAIWKVGLIIIARDDESVGGGELRKKGGQVDLQHKKYRKTLNSSSIE